MKRLLYVFPMLALSLILGCDLTGYVPDSNNDLATASQELGKTDKVEMCHFSELSGTWNLIEVSEKAVDKHLLNHPDNYPGYPVPSIPYDYFSPTCEVLPGCGPSGGPSANIAC